MEEEIKNEIDLIRVELRLSESELALIQGYANRNGVDYKSVSNMIYLVIARGMKFTPRVEKPKGQRGQGRKKKVVN